MGLSARRSTHAGVPVLHLGDELDSANSRELSMVLAAITAETCIVIVDLEHVTYVSSAPLGCLIAAHSRMRARRGALVLASVQRDVRRVFQLAAPGDLLPIFDTIDEAGDYLTLVERRRKVDVHTIRPSSFRAREEGPQSS